MHTFCKPILERFLHFISLSVLAAVFLLEYQDILSVPTVIATLAALICAAHAFPHSKIRTEAVFILRAAEVLALLAVPALPSLFNAPLDYNRFYTYYSTAFPVVLFSSFFVVLLTQFWIRFIRFRSYEPLMLLLLAALIFYPDSGFHMNVFSHPVYKSLFAVFFVFLQTLRIFLSRNYSCKNACMFLLSLLIYILLSFIIIQKHNTSASINNGGLIQPKLFQFDFSRFLSLENEISLNDNLVLIAHVPQEYESLFLRRLYLSGWDSQKGFFDADVPGEAGQIKTVSDYSADPETPDFAFREQVSQEIFTVNIDPKALIAFDYPVAVEPYRIWNTASFSGAYKTDSMVSGFFPFELYSVRTPSRESSEGLSTQAFDFYTSIDDETRKLVEPVAKKITENAVSYYDMILAVTSYFHDGDFRYSLKPGISPDGNQLAYFLDTAKKGYCTYFAFSMALMLRSLDIPARVAAGFFLEPGLGRMNYYPVRSNMAHAWVEVYFPEYGWISFDPTTSIVAEGEEVAVDSSAGEDSFTSLLEEILTNREFLIRDGLDAVQPETESDIRAFLKTAYSHKEYIVLFIALLICIVSVFFYVLLPLLVITYSRNNRKKILTMYALIARKSVFYAVDTTSDEFRALVSLKQKALYSQRCDSEDADVARSLFRKLRKKRIRLYSRTIACVLLFIFIMQSRVSAQDVQTTQDDTQETVLLKQSQEAIDNENWDTAVSLLQTGKKKHPGNGEFAYLLGTVYFNQKLYSTAYKELLLSYETGNRSTDIYSLLADSAGYLNKDEEALKWITLHLDTNSQDMFAWSTYGWLCYKTNRFEEGIKALHRVLETHGPDINVFASLANLYTAEFNYPEARKYYTSAIELAEERDQNYLAAIYYYNRSILEEVFYNFEDAYRDTVNSIQAMPRSSGYLMQGELFLRKLEYKAAYSSYLTAWNADSSPLPSLGLAETLLLSGYPNEALKYLSHIVHKTDETWIAHYGTTQDQFQADLAQLTRDCYAYLKNLEKRKIVHSLSTFYHRQIHFLRYAWNEWRSDAAYRQATQKVARYYEKKAYSETISSGQELYLHSFYYQTFKPHYKSAIKHLHRAKALETQYIPLSNPSYLFEEGLLSRKTELLEQAIRSFDPVWEVKYRSEALSHLISRIKNRKSREYAQLSLALFNIRPSAFSFHAIAFPVRVEYTDFSLNRNTLPYRLAQTLTQAGFYKSDNSPFILSIRYSEEDFFVQLKNENNNNTLFTQVFHNSSHSSDFYSQVINMLSTSLFRSDLGIQ